MKPILAIFALAAALPLAGAHAEPVEASETVRVSDLDLRTEEGRRSLDDRIRVAINAACGEASDVDLKGDRDIKRCRVEVAERTAVMRDRLIAEAAAPRGRVLAAQ